jgi:lipopolysaccharide export system ATP-binding protein
MLAAKGLRKAYRSREVVRDFALTLEAGEVVGLLGPNGAGKTTCFYMIVGLVPADAGQIVLDGKDITAEPMYARAKHGVGYLPQEPSVFRKLSVADNIRLVLELREDLDKAGIEKELASLLDELQITHVADQIGASLSGGERRRVEIARALAAKPRLMLLDEPFAGVDPISVANRAPPEEPWYRRADHRPQRSRDARHLRPRLHPQRRRRPRAGFARRTAVEPRRPSRLPGRYIPPVNPVPEHIPG